MPVSRPVPAGERTSRVLVERLKRSAVPDGGGHIDETDDTNWETASDVGTNGLLWASVVPRGSREFFRGEQVAADITHQVQVLYPAAKTIGPKYRLRLNGRKLNIAEPPRNIDEENHTLVFACVEAWEATGD